jgi:hypothetical protein
MSVVARLKEHGIELPEKTTVPSANYVPFRIDGNTVYISGQTPVVSGEVWRDILAGRNLFDVLIFLRQNSRYSNGIYSVADSRLT